MFLDKFYPLPEWKDKYRDDDDLGSMATRIAGKALYNQWKEVYRLTLSFADVLADDEAQEAPQTEEQWTRRLIYQNATIVAPKIVSASHCSLYILQMENASVIRFNCRQMMEQISYAALCGGADAAYKEVIEEAMERFRELFKEWVATFRKDDCEDEWGLYL